MYLENHQSTIKQTTSALLSEFVGETKNWYNPIIIFFLVKLVILVKCNVL